MDDKEFKSTLDQLKAQGMKDDDIMEMFYDMFKDNKVDKEDFMKMAESMGYKVDEEALGSEAADIPEGKEGEEALKDPLGMNEEKEVKDEKDIPTPTPNPAEDEKAEEEKAMKMFRV